MAELPSIPVLTLAEAVVELRATLASNSNLNNSDPFGVWETVVDLAAQARVDGRTLIAAMLRQGYPTTATGFFLDEHAKSLGLERIPARRAQEDVYVTTSAAGTVPAGTIVQTDLDASGVALRYLVVADVALSLPGGLVRVGAEQPGTAYNAGAERITTLASTLSFVSAISNPAGPVVAGVDVETDDLLRQRVLLRWPSTSRGSTYHAYVEWAREVGGIIKVEVLDENPRGPGTVDVVVAPASGLPTAEQLADVQALILARRPVGIDAQARAPGTRPTDVTLTLDLYAGAETDRDVWEARARAVFDTLGIGAEFYPADIGTALKTTYTGVKGVILASGAKMTPAGDELVVPGLVDVLFGELDA